MRVVKAQRTRPLAPLRGHLRPQKRPLGSAICRSKQSLSSNAESAGTLTARKEVYFPFCGNVVFLYRLFRESESTIIPYQRFSEYEFSTFIHLRHFEPISLPKVHLFCYLTKRCLISQPSDLSPTSDDLKKCYQY